MTRLHASIVLAAWLLALAGAALAASSAPPEQTCFRQLADSSRRDIDCEHPAWLTDQERADLRRVTRDMLHDASCLVTVRIARGAVDAAITKPDNTFQSPPQPVACEIKTKDGAITITGTFAPKVVFKDGRAVEATPGLADVQGVNSYLAWPVVQYVNRSPGIQKEMLAMINAWLERSGRRAEMLR